ncbi:MAG: hypothetical protein JNL34_14960 [Anaerolineae bacterium]|nr:hypothetical protein [Anaerolineae bacterium]
MPHTYTITLDTADDGTPLDLTPDVRALEWRLGSEHPEQALAPSGRARLTLYNVGGRYAAGVPDWAGRWLVIRCHDGETERVHFSGLVEAIRPGTGPDKAGLAYLDAVTADAGLSALTAALPPLVDSAPGPLIAALLAGLPLRRADLHAAWVLETTGFGELDTTSRLAELLALPVEADEGIARFAWAALGGLPANEALRQIVVSEGGRGAMDREGVFIFRDRHQPLRALPDALEFSGRMLGLELVVGEEWANCVQVHFAPVVLGEADMVLWTLERPQKLPPGTRRMTVRFHAANGESVAAWRVDRLIASAAEHDDGSGRPMPLEALIVAVNARQATLELRNPSAEDIWLLAGARLEGTPLYFGAALMAEQVDEQSMAFHGPRRRNLVLPLAGSLDDADGRARFELLRAPRPSPRAAWIDLDTRAAPQALAVTLGGRVRVRDSPSSHDAAYHVIGEAHTVDDGGARHRIRLFLEPASLTRFWEISLCALGSETALAY